MNKQSGFTLLELIIAIFIFSGVVALVAAFSVFFLKTYTFSIEENQSVSQAQQAMTRMIKEVREARPGDDGAWPLVQTDNTQFIFYSDVTNDGRSDRIRYFIENNQLKRGVIEPTGVPVTYPTNTEKISVLMDNIDLSNIPMFTYYNGNWPTDVANNPLSSNQRLLNTRLVGIFLRVNIQTGTGSQPFSLTSSVHIRSLKNNL